MIEVNKSLLVYQTGMAIQYTSSLHSITSSPVEKYTRKERQSKTLVFSYFCFYCTSMYRVIVQQKRRYFFFIQS